MLRELRGLTARNVADATKLSARYIEGIEEESYKKLPARPYLRGFLFSTQGPSATSPTAS